MELVAVGVFGGGMFFGCTGVVLADDVTGEGGGSSLSSFPFLFHLATSWEIFCIGWSYG
jgi:hypothetical protein